ncbi:MAG: hypothetical protein COZ56_20085 [Armatimonadetes bacterium CG_4_8_14_3_um_filter_58_9]|nr:MAG: hypothetical protein COZ56_20085 [Armatimonadetes bacterium CG_4_8_14_3_um_filter_58_9]PJB62943.1 MAG: hypothetical protein CO095_17535 [Armatimonadetes bacterium CG_4_9_14_3_um_filter_58_7]
MTLTEFESQVFEAAFKSAVCGIPLVRRRMPVSISLRVPLTVGGFVEVFYNEATGTTAFAVIENDQRVFGADNTGGWHIHPFNSSTDHLPLPGPTVFTDFLAHLEAHFSVE